MSEPGVAKEAGNDAKRVGRFVGAYARPVWSEWDDTGMLVLWCYGQKFHLPVRDAVWLAEDIERALELEAELGT